MRQIPVVISRTTHRLAAALLALWLVVVTAEPSWLHACPAHDGAATAGVADGHAGHGGSHDAPASGGQGSGSHACTCVGDCATTAPVALPLAASVPVAPVLDVALRARAIAGSAHRPVAPDFLLPFANGPPARA